MPLYSTEPGSAHLTSFFHRKCGAMLVENKDVYRVIARDRGEHTTVWARRASVTVGKPLGANAAKSARQAFLAGDDEEAAMVYQHEIWCPECGKQLMGSAFQNMSLDDVKVEQGFVYKLRIRGAKWSKGTVVARPYRLLEWKWAPGGRQEALQHIRPRNVELEKLPRRRAEEGQKKFPQPGAQGRDAGLDEKGMDAATDAAIIARGKRNRAHPAVVACFADHDRKRGLDTEFEERMITRGKPDVPGAFKKLPAMTINDLEKVKELHPRVLYVSAHGGEDAVVFRLTPDGGGAAAIVTPKNIADVLEATPSIELVFFSACSSHRFALAVHELRPEVCFLGFHGKVSDRVAIDTAGAVFYVLWKSNAKFVPLTKFVGQALDVARALGSELPAVLPSRRQEECVIHLCDMKTARRAAAEKSGKVAWLDVLLKEVKQRLLDRCRMLNNERVDRVESPGDKSRDVSEAEAQELLHGAAPVRLTVHVRIGLW